MQAMIFGAATTSVVRARPSGSSLSTRHIVQLALDAGAGESRGRGIMNEIGVRTFSKSCGMCIVEKRDVVPLYREPSRTERAVLGKAFRC